MSDLPAGFVLDSPSPGMQGLPAGFVMDQPSVILDAAKQLGAGLATGIEGIPATAPSLLNLAGQGVNALMKKYTPSLVDPQAEQNQQTLGKLIEGARNGGVAQYLPEPQTPVGEAVRTAASFIPSALGAPGSVARNLVAGTTAGLGAYGAGKIAPTPEAQPYFELGGALAGGAAGLRGAEATANRIAARAAPEASKIENAATTTYQNLRSAHAVQPIQQWELDNLASDLKTTLNKQGPRPSVAPGIHSAIDEIKNPATAGSPDVADLVSARQNIKSFFQNPLPDPNKAGAAIILPKIDAAIERLSPGTMQELRQADANYSSAKTAQTLDKRMARAEMRASGDNSGMNLGNKIRQNAASMLLSNKESRGLSPAESAGLEAVNKGTTTQNLLRLGSNLLGGGGGLGGVALGLAGGISGYETGHPELAALPLVGMGLRTLANRSITNQAANVGAMIRSRSPYAKTLGMKGPAPRLSRSTAGALGALYALPAARGILPIPTPTR